MSFFDALTDMLAHGFTGWDAFADTYRPEEVICLALAAACALLLVILASLQTR